jgi:hypothetical protein
MAMLAAHLEPRLNAAEKIELPDAQADVSADLIESAGTAGSAGPAWAADDGRRGGGWRVPWWVSLSGWAAVIALAVAWGLTGERAGPINDAAGGFAAQPAAALSPEEHLRQYMQAPYVLNEMPPVLLNTEDLTDGRIAVSFLRRIIEVRYVDAPEDIPVGENGELTEVPTRLSKEPPPALTPRQ